jgi:hypothetical protein
MDAAQHAQHLHQLVGEGGRERRGGRHGATSDDSRQNAMSLLPDALDTLCFGSRLTTAHLSRLDE